MAKKQEFYDHYGVEEYYEYDPRTNHLTGFRRQGEVWVRIRDFAAWTSPRLGVRFILSEEAFDRGPLSASTLVANIRRESVAA